jgi:hypothetical protein
MRFLDLNPHWLSQQEQESALAKRTGILFRCLYCDQILCVNLVGAGFKYEWVNTTEDFDTMSLYNRNGVGPHSLDFSHAGHCHITVKDGNIFDSGPSRCASEC